jgi:TolB-like protein
LLSLIVLPFVNLSGNSRQDYLVDSVTDHLTSELARIENSFVVARNTAISYRGDTLDVTEIGHELGVRYAIKGSVRAAASGLRINAQLIEAETAQHLWIDRFDIAIGEPFAMQREVVARLVPPLHANLLSASGRAPQPAPPVLPQDGNGTTGRGQTVIHPRGGTAVYPRGATPTATVRAAATQSAIAPAVAQGESRPPPVARRAAPAPSPGLQPAAQRRPFRIPFLAKLLIIIVAGVIALAMLGAERRSIVEIISWMLIAAGAVQMFGVISGGRRTG